MPDVGVRLEIKRSKDKIRELVPCQCDGSQGFLLYRNNTVVFIFAAASRFMLAF